MHQFKLLTFILQHGLWTLDNGISISTISCLISTLTYAVRYWCWPNEVWYRCWPMQFDIDAYLCSLILMLTYTLFEIDADPRSEISMLTYAVWYWCWSLRNLISPLTYAVWYGCWHMQSDSPVACCLLPKCCQPRLQPGTAHRPEPVKTCAIGLWTTEGRPTKAVPTLWPDSGYSRYIIKSL